MEIEPRLEHGRNTDSTQNYVTATSTKYADAHINQETTRTYYKNRER